MHRHLSNKRIDHVRHYLPILLLFMLLSSLTACKSDNDRMETAGTDSAVMKYALDDRDPPQAKLLSTSVYTRKEKKLVREIRINGADSTVSKYYRNYADTLLAAIKKRRDNVRYVLRNGSNELVYFNGELMCENRYDTHDRPLRSVWYMDNGDSTKKLVDEHEYAYNASGNLVRQVYTVDNTVLYEILYTYDKNGRLELEQYTRANPRPDNPQLPPDWVQYEYDGLGRLERKIFIIDGTVKKPYKKKKTDFFNRVNVIAYKYDAKDRLEREWIYQPVISFVPHENMQTLANSVDKVSDRFRYRYAILSPRK